MPRSPELATQTADLGFESWQLPGTYHLAGNGRGTATFKFYEGRDILWPGTAGESVRG